jgi:hypothetical protein
VALQPKSEIRQVAVALKVGLGLLAGRFQQGYLRSLPVPVGRKELLRLVVPQPARGFHCQLANFLMQEFLLVCLGAP